MAEDLQVRKEGEFPEATLRRPANVVGMTVLLAVLGVVLGSAAIVIPWVGKLLVMGLATPLFLIAAWVARKAPKGGTGLQVDLSGISVGGRLQLSRSLLNRATVVEEEGKTVVVLQSKLFVCLVDVRDGEEGRALIRALGMDPTGAISDFFFDSPLASRFPPWIFELYLLAPLLFFTPIFLGLLWLTLLLLVLWYLGLMSIALPEKLSVGLDGVMLRWLWRRRVIPFEEMYKVFSDEQGIQLHCRNGDVVQLSAYWTALPWERGWYKNSIGFGSRRAYLDAILARIEEARGAHKEAGCANAAVWLARRGQGLPDWLSKLQGLMASAQGNFRQEPLEPEQLWSTLEDARQPALLRAAAAAALAPSLDAGGRERLRVVSSVVVDPGLRSALDASIQEDEEALLRAFESLEQQQQQPPRAG